MFSAPKYRGPVSDHFDGKRFINQSPFPEKKLSDVIRWRVRGGRKPWPSRRGNEPGPPPPERVAGDELRITFINHATVLIQTAGLNILTDPVWAERVSPVSWAGPVRAIDPGLRFADLPPIDVVLVSHNHYDHLDIPTLRRLAAEHQPAIYLPLGNTALLDRYGIPGGRDLDWWDSVTLAPEVTLHFVPARHWSARGTCDRLATLWGGFVITAPGGPIYYLGDTGAGKHVTQVRERFGPPRLALTPIGAYLPRWFMKSAHMNPAEAVAAHQELAAGLSIAVHFGCWQLSNEGIDDPVTDLDAALVAAGLTREQFAVFAPGEGRAVPPLAD